MIEHAAQCVHCFAWKKDERRLTLDVCTCPPPTVRGRPKRRILGAPLPLHGAQIGLMGKISFGPKSTCTAGTGGIVSGSAEGTEAEDLAICRDGRRGCQEGGLPPHPPMPPPWAKLLQPIKAGVNILRRYMITSCTSRQPIHGAFRTAGTGLKGMHHRESGLCCLR